MYVDDNNSQYPFYADWVAHPVWPPFWFDVLYPYYKLRWTNQSFHCPAHKGPITVDWRITSEPTGSYAYNRDGTEYGGGTPYGRFHLGLGERPHIRRRIRFFSAAAQAHFRISSARSGGDVCHVRCEDYPTAERRGFQNALIWRYSYVAGRSRGCLGRCKLQDRFTGRDIMCSSATGTSRWSLVRTMSSPEEPRSTGTTITSPIRRRGGSVAPAAINRGATAAAELARPGATT